MRMLNVAVSIAGAAAAVLAVTAAGAPGAQAAPAGQGAAPPPALTLTGVSCSAATACTAVGSAYNSSSQPAPYVLRWNGKTWSQQTAPDPSADGTQLTGVSCPSQNDCVATGNKGGYKEYPVIEHWNGRTWAVQPNPLASTEQVALNGVSCSAATACTAVGSQLVSQPGLLNVALRWNGTAWTRQSTPDPAGAVNQLISVSCPAATSCTAVGTRPAVVGSGQTDIQAMQWNGTTWTEHPAAKPSGGPGRIWSVACTSATFCVMAGDNYANQGDSKKIWPVAEIWNGSTWKLSTVPNPAPKQQSDLFGVDCSAATACTTVGFYQTHPAGGVTMADRWNGTAWTQQHSATPPGVSVTLAAVSCPAARHCLAIGNNVYAGTGVAEQWNGTSWSLVTLPAA